MSLSSINLRDYQIPNRNYEHGLVNKITNQINKRTDTMFTFLDQFKVHFDVNVIDHFNLT